MSSVAEPPGFLYFRPLKKYGPNLDFFSCLMGTMVSLTCGLPLSEDFSSSISPAP